jgi:molybdopterin converting factor subunit 1
LKLRVRLFAAARECVGRPEIELELPDGATERELRAGLIALCPAIAAVLERSVLAIDNEYARPGESLREGLEVAVIPPVSGGGVLDD